MNSNLSISLKLFISHVFAVLLVGLAGFSYVSQL